MTVRLRFHVWLLALDIARSVFGYGSRQYLWVLSRAADADYRS